MCAPAAPCPPWPAVYVQNADIEKYIVKNMTQGLALQAASAHNATPSQAAELAAELLD